MADDAPALAGGAPAQGGGGGGGAQIDSHAHLHESVRQMKESTHKRTVTKDALDAHVSGIATPMSRPLSRHSLDLDDYFVGPRDLDGHSKLPYFMRMHGSVLPRMIIPLFCIRAWATFITCISEFVTKLGVNTVLLTVLGFVVGLSLSFRSSTAYERYSKGRKTWCTLMIQCRNVARYV
ncbi:hypothetical protein VE00_05489 [Pseudogymnoascus sp. WSF 3629]|nr:hypothetical protein VE00_05489 [Pseudogymnoascus sp. WSF 3629]